MKASVLTLLPARLAERLGNSAPRKAWILGNRDLLNLRITALFCSTRCPGDAILRAYDQAAKWRDEGRCVISGFHSPIEQECLNILLRGKQPIIICRARAMPKRVPGDWQAALDNNRLLLLSFFEPSKTRVTAELAAQRNEYVAALADEVWFAHIASGGQMEKLAKEFGPKLGRTDIPGP